jgi:pyrroloquinoline quinone (PQQ) biosynthesis protein C
VLGVPRLHYTITTGKVATKEAAARYALEVFEPRWHELIEDAIAYWHGDPPSQPYRTHPHRRHQDAVEFVACVIDAANRAHADTN